VEAQGVDEKDKWWFSVFDFINFVCEKDHNRTYAHRVFSRLVKDGSEYQNEVLSNCEYCKFAGQRQKSTPCMTIRGLQRLLMILGGKAAAEYRAIAEGVFTRCIAGDASLCHLMKNNNNTANVSCL
jgi:hypothetical protein